MEYLSQLRLSRVGEETEAGLWVTSLPWPRDPVQPLSLGGAPTAILPLGRWPGCSSPRRLLMFGDGNGPALESLRLGVPATRSTPRLLPEASAELFDKSPDENFLWESHLLRLRYGGRSTGIALGLRTGGQVLWWEACRLVVLEQSEECVVVEMGGSIPRKRMTQEELKQYRGYKNPYLHSHNWLSGQIFARFFANGVCEIYAHHINNKFVDDGAAFEDVVPVIGLAVEEGDALSEVPVNWDGSCGRIELNGVTFDLSEVCRLATPQHPGNVSREQGFLVLQPYEGVQLFGGIATEDRTGDAFIFRSPDKHFPRGMARTLRFSLSLSERSPRIVRYLAPAWWYGLCEEFLPEPLLPVRNIYEETVEKANSFIRENIVRGGFEDGAIPRQLASGKEENGQIFHEPGWEGEIAYGAFLSAWRSGDGELYNHALRAAYNFTDTAVDHAMKLVKMHGFEPNAFSLPMNRMLATIAAYLETGDPYLFNTAEAVITNAHWQNKNSWPRMTVGRDICYVRGAVLLYRYFGEDFFRRIALEGALSAAQSQRPNGSFGDQGGGAGLHQWSGYITKAWMGMLATNGMVDYLEIFPDEERLKETVKRFADWMLVSRWDHPEGKAWPYQWDYAGKDVYVTPQGAIVRYPDQTAWHQDNIARLMGYMTIETGDRRYLDAWAESYRIAPLNRSDHSTSAALQFLPWIMAKLWNARLCDGRVETAPVSFGERTPKTAEVMAPGGLLPVGITQSGD